MSSPQLEKGYTRIANELLEALGRIRISGEARQVFDVIVRKTYGFGKKKDRISLSQFVLATGLKRPEVCRAIRKLLSMKLIIKIDDKTGEIFSIQKDDDLWVPLAKMPHVAKMPIRSGKNANASLAKMPHTKETTTKETMTKEISGQALMVAEVLKLFEGVNANCKTMYGNTTQRKAVTFLLEEYGFEMVSKVIALLPKTNTITYLPTITTPLQLKDKWVSLEMGLRKEKNKENKNQKDYKVAF